MISTGGSFAPSSLVMSPTCRICGNRIRVTAMGKRFDLTGPQGLNTAAYCGKREASDPVKEAPHGDHLFHIAPLSNLCSFSFIGNP